MNLVVEKLKAYLSKITNEAVSINKVRISNLPIYIKTQYEFFELDVFDTKLIAVFVKESTCFKPVQFQKHMNQIPSISDKNIFTISETLPTYVRKRLIEKGISFVLPDIQMHLPVLGMAQKERTARIKSKTIEFFSPAAQIVFIYGLLGKIRDKTTALSLSKALGYSAMTIGRSLDELEVIQAATIECIGRERLISFPENKNEVWLKALPYLRTPILKVFWIIDNEVGHDDLCVTGITALSQKSMIAEPMYCEHALSKALANKLLKKEGLELTSVEEPNSSVIQVWRYDPKILATEGVVDPFSLYLSLYNDPDDRIQIALEELMGKYL